MCPIITFLPLISDSELRSTSPTGNAEFNNAVPNVTHQDEMKKLVRRGEAMPMFSIITKFGKWRSGRRMMDKTKSVAAQVQYLGHTTFPINYADQPVDGGVVIHDASVPGGGMASYDLGRV